MSGLTPEGWVPKTEAEILADIAADQRALVDAGIDTSPDSVIGKQNRIMAKKLAQLWNVGTDLFNMLDPDQVHGAQQDALASLTNTLRQAPSKSRVMATVNLEPGTSIPIGNAVASVLGNDEARFVNTEPMVNETDDPLDVDVVFEAEGAGPLFVANAGTLTVIETVLTGWTSITNDDDADPLGKDAEGDAAFAVRRQQELASPGGCTLIGLRADLYRVSDVRAVQVLENTDSIVVDGMPPHSVEAIVLGGTDAAIAAAVLRDTAGGVTSHGDELVVVTDDEGEDHDVRFSRPDVLEAYVALELEVDDDTYAGDAAVKAAIVLASEGGANPARIDPSFLEIGTNVYSGRIVCSAVAVPGVLNARAGLAFTAIATPDDVDAVTKLEVGSRAIADLETTRIAVVVLS